MFNSIIIDCVKQELLAYVLNYDKLNFEKLLYDIFGY